MEFLACHICIVIRSQLHPHRGKIAGETVLADAAPTFPRSKKVPNHSPAENKSQEGVSEAVGFDGVLKRIVVGII
jgi:hypothetical protein